MAAGIFAPQASIWPRTPPHEHLFTKSCQPPPSATYHTSSATHSPLRYHASASALSSCAGLHCAGTLCLEHIDAASSSIECSPFIKIDCGLAASQGLKEAFASRLPWSMWPIPMPTFGAALRLIPLGCGRLYFSFRVTQSDLPGL